LIKKNANAPHHSEMQCDQDRDEMRIFPLAIVLFVASLLPTRGYFDSNGNDYYARCAATENVICTATAAAYLDMMYALGYKCPRDAGINRIQTKDILVKYLADHPGERHMVLPFSAILAFQEALGCAVPKQR
jgi:hypothetical protein